MTETQYNSEPDVAMNGIAKIDAPAGAVAAHALDAHPALVLWSEHPHGLLARIHAAMALRGAHPARTVVLLPFAHLRPLATRLWPQCFADGFAPRFETTMSWSAAVGSHVPGPTDIAFDMALDTLTAQALLAKAGLGAQQDALSTVLVQAAHQLGPLAAACRPQDRGDWVQAARRDAVLGMDGPALAWEAAVARIAVEWAGVSAYASDVLFSPEVRGAVDCLVLVQGFSPDPLALGLQACWGAQCVKLTLLQSDAPPVVPADASRMALHACQDAEDEAQRSTACVVRHIAAGRLPVALVSSDRALTRRVRATLEGAGVQIRDENGWKLSTSHCAAQLMALLRAAAWNASTDAVLDWVKAAPAFSAVADALEAALRRDQVRDWRSAAHAPTLQKKPELVQAHAHITALREPLKGRRSLAAWLPVVRGVLHASGMLEGLKADAAGVQLLAVLRLDDPAPEAWTTLLVQALWAGRRMDLVEFTAWVNQSLEGARFSPAYPRHEQVVILPMSQMLGRPFGAVVLAGCDEVRLNPSPEPPGGWTPQQRAALGLPSREDLDVLTRAAWHNALQTPCCDVLWRTSDDAGETLLPSTLVQLLQLELGDPALADDPRDERHLAVAPVRPPLPSGAAVPVSQLSASAYEDLRDCPYRFFALRQLGLKTAEELDGEVGKRDFGLWLHEVLKVFHEALAAQDATDPAERQQLLEVSAQATTQALGLPEGEFLPFVAAWPAVREGYLAWLDKHEATGARFTSAETAHQQALGEVTLVGRIDRIDTLPDGTVVVLDYKTEASARTSARVKFPLEDTQIAFYAALLPHDSLQAAYVNVGEREATRTYVQAEVVPARDALLEGILHDLQRIRAGAALPALGEGSSCDYCQARGLCRKDFWTLA